MVQEKVRLGETLRLPDRVQETFRAAEGDELIMFYHENGILILKDLGNLPESLGAFVEIVPSTHEDYRARIAEMAAQYETSALAQLAAAYEGSDELMLPDLEALYLEAEQEIHKSHLPPLREGMTIDLPPGFPAQSQTDG